MFPVKRNQVIITALVVMIALAGYLNYTDNKLPEGFTYDEKGDLQALIKDKDIVETSGENINNLTNYEVIEDNTDLDNVSQERQEKINKNKKESSISENENKNKNKNTNNEQIKSEPGEAMFVNSSNDSSYFVQAKLEREQSRSKQKEILLELINNQNLDQTVKADSADAMLEIQKKIERESAAEAMIESKGFSEVFVRIGEDTVDVVVNKEDLSDSELAQIEDIVRRKTGLDTEAIRITPIKMSNKK